jgi:TDG/mug DNA glycosylase family protein
MSDLLPRFGALPDTHTVPDVLDYDLNVVFCGTALGRASAQAKAYYANPGNFFWRTVHAVGLTPRLLAPEEYPTVLAHKIGLTDLCKTAYGQDAELPDDAFDTDALREKIMEYQPRVLAFTSKTGAAAMLGHDSTAALRPGPLEEYIGATQLWVLPSPSGQARKFWKIAPWQQLAAHLLGS